MAVHSFLLSLVCCEVVSQLMKHVPLLLIICDRLLNVAGVHDTNTVTKLLEDRRLCLRLAVMRAHSVPMEKSIDLNDYFLFWQKDINHMEAVDDRFELCVRVLFNDRLVNFLLD